MQRMSCYVAQNSIEIPSAEPIKSAKMTFLQDMQNIGLLSTFRERTEKQCNTAKMHLPFDSENIVQHCAAIWAIVELFVIITAVLVGHNYEYKVK